MARSKDFDPLAYIESAFLDSKPRKEEQQERRKRTGVRFTKTKLSAPRPRRVTEQAGENIISEDFAKLLENMPATLNFLAQFYADDVTRKYYKNDFKETREEFIKRIIDPELSLSDASRLLGVCPATIRRYTNRDWLSCHRSKGGQRRFRLSNIIEFVDKHGRLPKS